MSDTPKTSTRLWSEEVGLADSFDPLPHHDPGYEWSNGRRFHDGPGVYNNRPSMYSEINLGTRQGQVTAAICGVEGAGNMAFDAGTWQAQYSAGGADVSVAAGDLVGSTSSVGGSVLATSMFGDLRGSTSSVSSVTGAAKTAINVMAVTSSANTTTAAGGGVAAATIRTSTTNKVSGAAAPVTTASVSTSSGQRVAANAMLGGVGMANSVQGQSAAGSGKTTSRAAGSTSSVGGSAFGNVAVKDNGVTQTRDPLKQPFSSASIWNMPIGDAAVYVPANLGQTSNPDANIYAHMPGADGEVIVLTPNAPLTDVRYSSAGWSGSDRCVTGGAVMTSVPMPSGFIVPNGNTNSGAAIMKADGRTISQMQPLARCSAGGYATALTTPLEVDLYGTGIPGMHGGSGLSSIGGSIRLGELRPGQQGPRHALKVNVYAKAALFESTTRAQGFRWPATTSDSYSVGWYGTYGTGNTNTAMKQGSLLAIPASVDITTLGLQTEPARQLAWTLQNYGAYIVDDGYAPGIDFSVEEGAAGSKQAEFQADFGFPFLQKAGATTAWVSDIKKLVAALYVVDNNTPSTIGGGGNPRQPLAPAI